MSDDVIGELVVRVTGDISDLQNKMAKVGSTVKDASDKAGGGLAGMVGHLAPLAGVVGGVGLAAGAFGVASVKSAADFQSAMTKVKALAAPATENMKQMSDSVLKMASDVGQSPKSLAEGLYFVESAGFHGKAALDLLKTSAKAAAAGMTDTLTVADGATSAINTFGKNNLSAQSAVDIMTKTVSAGKMEYGNYAHVVGMLSVTTKASGHTFQEANAALATFTNSGMSAQKGSTYLQNAMTMMSLKTASMAKNATALGISFDATKFKTMSLGDQIEYVNKVTKGNDSVALKLMNNNSVAAKSYMMLRDHIKDYKSTLNDLNHAQGTTDDAFKLTEQTFHAQANKMKAAFDVVKINIGTSLLPALGSIMGAITPLIGAFSGLAVQGGPIANMIARIGTTLSGAAQKAADFVKVITSTTGQIPGPINKIIGLVMALKPAFDSAMNSVKSIVDSTRERIKIFMDVLTSPQMRAFSVQAANLVAAVLRISAVINQSANGPLRDFAKMIQTQILPMLTGLMKGLTDGANAFSKNKPLVDAVTRALIGLGVAIGAMKIAGMIKQFADFNIKAAVEFIGSMKKMGAGVMTFVTESIPQFVASMQKMALGVVTFVTESIPSFIASIPAMVAGFGAWAAGAWAAAAGMIAATWPIMLIIAAIALLVVGIVLLVTHWTQVTAFLKGIWDAFTKWLLTTFAPLISGFKMAFSAIGNFLSGFWNGTVAVAKNIWGGLQKFFQASWEVIKTIFKIAIAFLALTVFLPFTLAILAIMAIWKNFHKPIEDAWNKVKALVSAAAGVVKSTISGWMSAIGGVIQAGWARVTSVVGAAIAAVRGVISAGWSAIVAVVSALLAAIVAKVQAIWNSIVGIIGAAGAGIMAAMSGPFTSAAGLISGIVAGIVNVVQGMWNTVSGIFGKIGGAANSVIDKVNSVTGASIPHFATGTNSAPGGPALVGENGPEIVNLQAGTRVLTNGQTASVLKAAAPSNVAQSGMYAKNAQGPIIKQPPSHIVQHDPHKYGTGSAGTIGDAGNKRGGAGANKPGSSSNPIHTKSTHTKTTHTTHHAGAGTGAMHGGKSALGNFATAAGMAQAGGGLMIAHGQLIPIASTKGGPGNSSLQSGLMTSANQGAAEKQMKAAQMQLEAAEKRKKAAALKAKKKAERDKKHKELLAKRAKAKKLRDQKHAKLLKDREHKKKLREEKHKKLLHDRAHKKAEREKLRAEKKKLREEKHKKLLTDRAHKKAEREKLRAEKKSEREKKAAHRKHEQERRKKARAWDRAHGKKTNKYGKVTYDKGFNASMNPFGSSDANSDSGSGWDYGSSTFATGGGGGTTYGDSQAAQIIGAITIPITIDGKKLAQLEGPYIVAELRKKGVRI